MRSQALEGACAIVYGGAGALGGAAARAFARAGATVFLVGRTQRTLDAAAGAIVREGGEAYTAAIDIFDAAAIAEHARRVAERGRIGAALVAVGIEHVQGAPLLELSRDAFEHPINAYMRAHFSAAQAVASHLIAQRSGVFITISTQAAMHAFPGVLGYGTACAAIEGFTRHLAGELAPHGARAVCIRSDAIPEAADAGSHSNAVFEAFARAQGISVQEMLANAAQSNPLRRLPTLSEFGACAAFAASSAAANMTGSVINITGGQS